MEQATSPTPLQSIQQFEVVKLLGDPLRRQILRYLMSEPATLSQLSRYLDTYPAQVRHHVKSLETAGLVQLARTQVKRGVVRKFYRATAQAYSVNLMILPERLTMEETVVAVGSDDLALGLLAAGLEKVNHGRSPRLLSVPVGSLNGLVALRQGAGHLSGSHLLDAPSGEYNAPYVRHLFPGQEMVLLTLAHRQQGLLVAPGNPHEIWDLTALARSDLVLANRPRGAGTRVWLDRQLKRLGVPWERVTGYERPLPTHAAVAATIAAGEADVGVGLVATGIAYELDVIPLFEERYDLVLPATTLRDPLLQALLDYLQTAVLRQEIRTLDGYDSTHTGEVLKVT